MEIATTSIIKQDAKGISNTIPPSRGREDFYLMSKTIEELRKMVKRSPDRCPITGLLKCESYTIGDNVVYLTRPAYDAYTLPEYNPEEKTFYRTHYDMDDDNREEIEFLCELDDLRDRPDFQQIKEYYGIA